MPVASRHPSVVIRAGPRRHARPYHPAAPWPHCMAGPVSSRMAPGLPRPHPLPGWGPILPTCQEPPMGPGAGVWNRPSPGSAQVPRPLHHLRHPQLRPKSRPLPHRHTPAPCPSHRPVTEAPQKALPSRLALARTATALTASGTWLTAKPGDIHESISRPGSEAPREQRPRPSEPVVVPTAGANSHHRGARHPRQPRRTDPAHGRPGTWTPRARPPGHRYLKMMFSRSKGYSMMPVVGTRTRSTSCWVGR